MKEMIKIIVGLIFTCLLAAFIMGTVFIFTAKAKKHNEYINFKENMFTLLGYDKKHPAGDDLKLLTVYRYLIKSADKEDLGYMVPVQKGGFELVTLDTAGTFLKRVPLSISQDDARDIPGRKKAVQAALAEGQTPVYADMFIVALKGEKRLAYLVPGSTPGFKTAINFMLALNQNYAVKGLEILEHQEDPGLGAEIEQEYFKNQFRGKSLERIKTLKVIKEPLPDEYLKFLETQKWAPGAYTDKEITALRQKYHDKDINAITGATISSRAVVNGVKNTVKKFAYRVQILDEVIQANKITAAF